MFLDVVYNHFGPSGNYLPNYAASFFTERHETAWGAGINFDGEAAAVVLCAPGAAPPPPPQQQPGGEAPTWW